MRRCLLSMLLVTAAACSHAPAAPTREPLPACSTATVVVLTGTGATLVDPVETWREVFASPAFTELMAKTSPLVQASTFTVQRRGRSAVLQLGARAGSDEAATATCHAALEAAFAFGKEALEFLQQQERALTAEHADKEKALRAFEASQDLVGLPVEDQLALGRERLREATRVLQDPARHAQCRGDAACRASQDVALQAARESTRQDVLRLVTAEQTLARLRAEVEDVVRRRALVRERLAQASLAAVVQQDLRVLDRCARCR